MRGLDNRHVYHVVEGFTKSFFANEFLAIRQSFPLPKCNILKHTNKVRSRGTRMSTYLLHVIQHMSRVWIRCSLSVYYNPPLKFKHNESVAYESYLSGVTGLGSR